MVETKYPMIMFIILTCVMLFSQMSVCTSSDESESQSDECSEKRDILAVPSGLWTSIGAAIILGLTFYFMFNKYKYHQGSSGLFRRPNSSHSIFYLMMCVYILILSAYTMIGGLSMFIKYKPFIKAVSIQKTKETNIGIGVLHGTFLSFMLFFHIYKQPVIPPLLVSG